MLKMYDDMEINWFAAFIYDFKARKKANSNSDCSLIFQIYLKNLLELTSFHWIKYQKICLIPIKNNK